MAFLKLMILAEIVMADLIENNAVVGTVVDLVKAYRVSLREKKSLFF